MSSLEILTKREGVTQPKNAFLWFQHLFAKQSPIQI